MADIAPSYLTCTAAQAEEFNATNPHGFQSLNELLESRAFTDPDVCVAGFPELSHHNSQWTLLKFTYFSLLTASNRLATRYIATTSLSGRSSEDKKDRIVALLSPSCADLLVSLFAALRLGYGVLLLAPQNTPQAIAHLCQVTSSTHLMCHPSLVQLAKDALAGMSTIAIVEMPPRSVWRCDFSAMSLIKVALPPAEESSLTALVMHTSGSTGTPKPIYHPHRIWTQAIPCMPGQPAFTTTPLFHGGSADLLRSMNAVSTLYLFPSVYPITVDNVLSAMSASPGTMAFLSVPYILKMLAEDTDGLKMLQRMSLVSVGGAPLPEKLGDMMVDEGVHLVSRLGSSECGFLMSSHRDYEKDFDWAWLRNYGRGIELLHFEPVEDSENLYELVVDRDWSTLVVSNRSYGDFATGDLYAKNLKLENSWKYCGRADDVIVMLNGKKASAHAIETKLRASPDIAEAIAFGASKPLLGVLVVPASQSTSSDKITECIRDINASSSPYAAIIEEMIVILPHRVDLPKTSKGSIIRPQALKQFHNVIEEAYSRLANGSGPAEDVAITSDDDLKFYLRSLVKQSTHNLSERTFHDDDDLFELGITSLHAIQIRASLQKIVAPSGQVLSSNVVFEYPCIRKLAQHIMDVKFGRHADSRTEQQQQQQQLMRDLLEQYGTFSGTMPITAEVASTADSVLLTGATGALGAHILVTLIQRTNLHVFALVRAENDDEAYARLQSNLEERHLNPIDRNRLTVLAANLPADHLGLPMKVYGSLTARIQLIVHAAWPVNFAYGLESFGPMLKGTRALLDLAHHCRAKMVFCSSTAAAINDASLQGVDIVLERLPCSERSPASMGYAQSKWIAEFMCDRAYQISRPSGRVAVARIGQLCGDTRYGIWNEKEGWPLLIASMKYTGCLPILKEEVLWLPYDLAAETIIDLALGDDYQERTTSEVPVYHVVNPHRTSWTSLLDCLCHDGISFEMVSTDTWLERLRTKFDELDCATRELLSLWEQKYASADGMSMAPDPNFDTMQAMRTSETLRIAQAVHGDLMHKFVQRWKESSFLSSQVSDV